MIVTTGGETSAVAAKAATTTIPIVFNTGTTRSGLGWSPVSPDQAATRLGSISSQQSWLRNGWGYCSMWFRRRLPYRNTSKPEFRARFGQRCEKPKVRPVR